MEPIYRNGRFNFCWRPGNTGKKPDRFDIVIIRLAGRKVMLLKRVVAFGGETVEFRQGQLYINGKLLDEPYVKNLPSRTWRKAIFMLLVTIGRLISTPIISGQAILTELVSKNPGEKN